MECWPISGPLIDWDFRVCTHGLASRPIHVPRAITSPRKDLCILTVDLIPFCSLRCLFAFYSNLLWLHWFFQVSNITFSLVFHWFWSDFSISFMLITITFHFLRARSPGQLINLSRESYPWALHSKLPVLHTDKNISYVHGPTVIAQARKSNIKAKKTCLEQTVVIKQLQAVVPGRPIWLQYLYKTLDCAVRRGKHVNTT